MGTEEIRGGEKGDRDGWDSFQLPTYLLTKERLGI